jgi:anti-anti-sigma regulatory factor
MPEGRILRGRDEEREVIKLVGRVRHTISRTLDAVVEGLFAAGRAALTVFDLSEATDLDSTVLGLMAKAARKAREAGAPKPVILSPGHDIDLVLSSMGFYEVFEIVAQPPRTNCEMHELPSSHTADVEPAAVILDAHRALAELSEKNRAVFDKVVAMMEKDIEKKRSGADI